MEHTSTSYISLLIIILLASFVPIILRKIKFLPIPLVVGEIIAGMIVGKSGFNLIHTNDWLDFLATFGFAFLMFLSGLEIDFHHISNKANKNTKLHKSPLGIAILTFSLTLGLSYIISYILKLNGLVTSPFLMALILSTTSLGIVVPVLKEKNLLTSGYGQTILLAALIADFVTMVLITVFVTFYTIGFTYHVLLVFILFIAFYLFYQAGVKVTSNKLFKDFAHATSQLEVRGSFALILIFIALAQQLGTEIILGAFLAGLIVSLISESDSSILNMKLDAIGYGFFVPIFFITVGANFDIQSVFNNPKSIYLIPLLLLSLYLVKVLPALLLTFNFSLKKSIGAGFLLSSRLSLIIAASAIGLKIGAISEATNGAIILLAIITCTLSPLLFNPFAPKSLTDDKTAIFIFGINEQTLLLAQKMIYKGIEVTMLTSSKDAFRKAKNTNCEVLVGEPTDARWLKDVGIQKAKTVVVSTSKDEINTEICRICHQILDIKNIILLSNNPATSEGRKLYEAKLVTPTLATIFMVENLITHPQAFDLFVGDTDYIIEEVALKNFLYFNKSLKKVHLPGNCLILSILRNGEKIIPHGTSILKQNDIIMIIGSKDDVLDTCSLLGDQEKSDYFYTQYH